MNAGNAVSNLCGAQLTFGRCTNNDYKRASQLRLRREALRSKTKRRKVKGQSHSGYTSYRHTSHLMGMQLLSRKTKGDVNTYLGMKSFGLFTRENTRIKKYWSGIFIHSVCTRYCFVSWTHVCVQLHSSSGVRQTNEMKKTIQ